ncbi:hypothetical protein P3S67_018402 [Capsicum chacoense]
MRVLDEAYVPATITGGEMEHMVGQVFEAYKISFYDDELPPEGRAHNRALHITLQYDGRMISRVLINPGSGKPLNALGYMRWFGYEEDKGLGARLQGLIDHLLFEEKEFNCGLGYVVDEKKDKAGNTPDPVLSLYQIFYSAGFLKNDEVNKITEMLKRLTLREDITFPHEDQDKFEIEEVDLIENEIMEVDMTWMDIGGKLMKGYEPGKGLGEKL